MTRSSSTHGYAVDRSSVRAAFTYHKYQRLYTLSQHFPSPQQYCSRVHRFDLHIDADAAPMSDSTNASISGSLNVKVTAANAGGGAGRRDGHVADGLWTATVVVFILSWCPDWRNGTCGCWIFGSMPAGRRTARLGQRPAGRRARWATTTRRAELLRSWWMGRDAERYLAAVPQSAVPVCPISSTASGKGGWRKEIDTDRGRPPVFPPAGVRYIVMPSWRVRPGCREPSPTPNARVVGVYTRAIS